MILCFISDTHNNHEKLEIPECDILIHSGDATNGGTEKEIGSFFWWLGKQDQVKKILFVPGNHDGLFDSQKSIAMDIAQNSFTANGRDASDLTIESSGIQSISEISFFCYSVSRKYGNYRFMKDEFEIKRDLDFLVEDDIDCDIFVTHSPPRGVLDYNSAMDHCGSFCLNDMYNRVDNKPKIWAFGHIHESFGVLEARKTTFVNAAMMSHAGMRRSPVVFNFRKDGLILP